jgi:hypothetical protein
VSLPETDVLETPALVAPAAKLTKKYRKFYLLALTGEARRIDKRYAEIQLGRQAEKAIDEGRWRNVEIRPVQRDTIFHGGKLNSCFSLKVYYDEPIVEAN